MTASAVFGARYAVLSARYAMAEPIFALGSVFNMFGRPVVALVFAIVLISRLHGLVTRRINIDTPRATGIAKLAEVGGIVLLSLFYPLLVVVLFLEFNVPGSQRSQLPITILFGPLLSALPAGYFLFEMGRLIEKDKRGVRSNGTDVIDIDDVIDLEDVIDLQDPTASPTSDRHVETGNPYQPPT